MSRIAVRVRQISKAESANVAARICARRGPRMSPASAMAADERAQCGENPSLR
jgi:hypothetical protein